MTSGPFTVAIDGPAASGKGTIARAIADHFGFAHMDTGLLYRAVGAKVLAGAVAEDAASQLQADDLHADGLRSAEVAQEASKAAALPKVRAALVELQRSFASRLGGAVLDGRDIGTVICPQAQVKLFVIAAPEVRARRRLRELTLQGSETTFQAVFEDICARDARDSARADAPLVAAPDAVTIDTSEMQIADAVATAISIVEGKFTA